MEECRQDKLGMADRGRIKSQRGVKKRSCVGPGNER